MALTRDTKIAAVLFASETNNWSIAGRHFAATSITVAITLDFTAVIFLSVATASNSVSV